MQRDWAPLFLYFRLTLNTIKQLQAALANELQSAGKKGAGQSLSFPCRAFCNLLAYSLILFFW